MLPADHSGQVWLVGAALWWEDGPFSAGGQGRLEIPSERCLCSALASLLTVQGLSGNQTCPWTEGLGLLATP